MWLGGTLGLLMLCGVAADEGPNNAIDPDLRTAIARYDALDYAAVLPLLRRVLARPELSLADTAVALAYLGRIHAVLRQPRAATEAFIKLLQKDNNFDIGRHESPLIQAAFRRARAAVGPPRTQTDATPPAVLVASPAPKPAATTPPPAPRDRAVADDSNTWVWWVVAGGVAVVAGTSIAVLAAQPWRHGPPAPGTLGLWQLP